MFPGAGRLSARPVPAPFLSPKDEPYNPLVSLEYGGAAIQTPVQSRLVRVWAAFVEDDVVYVAPLDGSTARVAVITAPGITTLSLAFDTNMNVTLAYMQDGLAKLRWFDSSVNQIVTTTYPGVTSVQVTADDKRDTQQGRSDIVMVYVRDGSLYYRQQRDRYGTEYLLKENVPGQIERLGMNEVNRLQIELK